MSSSRARRVQIVLACSPAAGDCHRSYFTRKLWFASESSGWDSWADALRRTEQAAGARGRRRRRRRPTARRGDLGRRIGETCPWTTPPSFRWTEIRGFTDSRRADRHPGGGRRSTFACRRPARREVVCRGAGRGKARLVREAAGPRRSPGRRMMADAASLATLGLFMPAMCMRFWPEWEMLKRARRRRRPTERCSRLDSPAWGCQPGGWFRRRRALRPVELLDLHVHDTDFVYHLFGKPEGVFSRGIHR